MACYFRVRHAAAVPATRVQGFIQQQLAGVLYSRLQQCSLTHKLNCNYHDIHGSKALKAQICWAIEAIPEAHAPGP